MENEKNHRILEIYFRAFRGEAISTKQLANEYGVSAKSISRDISIIQTFLAEHRDLTQNAELTYSYKEHAYHLNSDEFLENRELLALVKVILGSRCFSKEEVLNILVKLKRFTTIHDRQKFENLIRKEVYHYHEVKSDCPSVIDNLWKLSQIIEDRRTITITYYKMNRDEVRRKMKPVSLLFSEYYFYLVAYLVDDDTNQARFFRVDRIAAITEHRETFQLEKAQDFDEGELREKNQFMFPGRTEKIRFSFCGPSVQAILDRLPTAKIVEKDGNTSILEAEVNLGRGIVMYLLSQGSWVQVLSPQSLVEEIQAELRQMLDGYTKSNT